MTKRVLVGLCAVIAEVCVVNPFAQEREDRTLLTHDQMRAIVNEASGERAMHHVLELVPYPRIRPIACSATRSTANQKKGSTPGMDARANRAASGTTSAG